MLCQTTSTAGPRQLSHTWHKLHECWISALQCCPGENSCPEGRKAENYPSGMREQDPLEYMCAHGCLLKCSTELWEDKSTGWPGELAFHCKQEWSLHCDRASQASAGPGRRMSATPGPSQPRAAHHLIQWHQDMSKEQAPGTPDAYLQLARSYTGQWTGSVLSTYLGISWWQNPSFTTPFVSSREVSSNQAGRCMCRVDQSVPAAYACSHPLRLPQMSKNSTWSHCTCVLPSPDKSAGSLSRNNASKTLFWCHKWQASASSCLYMGRSLLSSSQQDQCVPRRFHPQGCVHVAQLPLC